MTSLFPACPYLDYLLKKCHCSMETTRRWPRRTVLDRRLKEQKHASTYSVREKVGLGEEILLWRGPLQDSGRLGGLQDRLDRLEPIGLQADLLSPGIRQRVLLFWNSSACLDTRDKGSVFNLRVGRNRRDYAQSADYPFSSCVSPRGVLMLDNTL